MMTLRFEPTPTWLHALEEPDCACHLLLLVEGGGVVVGWCRASPDNSGESGELGLGLLAAFRNQGLGSRLVEQALTWASIQGWRQVLLSSWPDNLPATALFRKFGFVPTDAWRGREQVMVRSL